MEPFEIACPHCDGKLRVANPSLLGRKVKCPKCRDAFTVPTAEDLEMAARELEDQEASIGVGAGSGVGSSVSGGKGSSLSGTVGRSGIGGFSFTPSAEAEDVRVDADDEEPAPPPRRGRQPVPPIQMKNLAMVVGLPVGLLVVGALMIFWSKGYFSTRKDHRQDASKFTNWAKDIEENVKWVPQADNRYKGSSSDDEGGFNNGGNSPKRSITPRKRSE